MTWVGTGTVQVFLDQLKGSNNSIMSVHEEVLERYGALSITLVEPRSRAGIKSAEEPFVKHCTFHVVVVISLHFRLKYQ